MDRQSVARASILKASNSSTAAQNNTSHQRLLEQKKEYEALVILDGLSQIFARHIENICDDAEIMADAAVVQGRVLGQWPEASRILNKFISVQATMLGSSIQSDTDERPATKGERLVRIPLDEL